MTTLCLYGISHSKVANRAGMVRGQLVYKLKIIALNIHFGFEITQKKQKMKVKVMSVECALN